MNEVAPADETTPVVNPAPESPRPVARETVAATRLADALDLAFNHPWKMAGRAFTHGMMSAIGAAFGTVLIVVVSGYVANQLGLFSTVLNKVQDAVVNTQRKAVQQIEQPTATPFRDSTNL